ncbi:putative beta-lactamase transpeptidase-like [Rosellinia necatrix]|uniref:Putative beta-lactamase transpeptidase-like n=1 Tax=Rosellinia necatrix TaxID=77044 RepID=A0A1S8A9Q5_ROSNE|nr:putative beta-lactamase transpeptidase-like [Rosellinia necatrix]
MKPIVHTANSLFSVGGPWEIWRTRSQITNGRVVDLYTKSGSVGQYSSQLILLPDYGVTVSVLVAGPSSGPAISIATEMVLQSLIPTLENITLSDACESLCGTYETLEPRVNSSISIAADAAGLHLDRWVNHGVDIKAAAQAYALQSGSSPIRSVRFQASNLRGSPHAGRTTRDAHRVAYRLIFDTTGEDQNGPARVLDPISNQWSAADSIMYGEIGVDDFVVHFDANGTAMMIEPRVVRDKLQRSSQARG